MKNRQLLTCHWFDRGTLIIKAAFLCSLLGGAPFGIEAQNNSTVAGVSQPTTQASPLLLGGVTSSVQNPLQIAILHWYNANLTAQFPPGSLRLQWPSMGPTFERQMLAVATLPGYGLPMVRSSELFQ